MELVFSSAIAICCFVALQSFFWALSSHRPRVEGHFSLLSLAIAAYLYCAQQWSFTTDVILAENIVGLQTGISILVMAQLLYFATVFADTILPKWILAGFYATALGLFLTNTLLPYGVLYQSIRPEQPAMIFGQASGYFRGELTTMANIYALYFALGFGLISAVAFRLYRTGQRLDSGVLASYVLSQLAVILWAIGIDGQVTSNYMAAFPFFVLALVVSLRLSVERRSLAEQVLAEQQSSANERLARRKLELSLQEMAHTDQLTGLPNRLHFLESVDELLGKTQPDTFHIYLYGIKHFKDVNYAYGQSTGDEILRQAASRLRHDCADATLVARVAGDVFAVLVKREAATTEDEDALGSLEGHERVLKVLQVPYYVFDHSVSVDYSVGVVYSDRVINTDSANELLVNAEYAMQLAKVQGNNSAVVYDANIKVTQEKEHRMVKALRGAQSRGELALAYQLKVNCNHEIQGMEALLRWHSQEFGTVSPVDFIPLAERYGLMPMLGEWVALQVCEQLAEWLHSDLNPGRLAFNVSPYQLKDGSFSALIQALLKKYAIDPTYLEVEITESALINDFERVKRELDTLREMGVHVAIDDFGTGYSSLAYLGQLPFDSLKIDKQFIDNIGSSEGAEVVRSIVHVGQVFGSNLVAEGVEAKEQVDALIELGVQTFQGYYFSKPLSARDMHNILTVASGYFQERKLRAVPDPTDEKTWSSIG